MKSYTGIGSRDISELEKQIILDLSKRLSIEYTVYSGNADGADIAFQTGSGENNIAFLPWTGFNKEAFNYEIFSKDYFVVGQEKDGLDSVAKYHPNGRFLRYGARCLMARNYYQIMGYSTYPRSSFVICCASPMDDGSDNVEGGTGQAVRIAIDLQIPVVNIRKQGWEQKLKAILK